MSGSKVQQLITLDELMAGEIEQKWLDTTIAVLKLVPARLPAEVKVERAGDTNVTTLWCRGQAVAIAIRQRNEWNTTVLTLVQVAPVIDGASS